MNEIYEELNQIYGSSDLKHVPITHDDIKDMKLLERVIKGNSLLRSCYHRSESNARCRGIIINHIKGQETGVYRKILFNYNLHRNEKHWAQPLVLDSDGFLPGRHSSSNFFPFSYGCRNCIGQKFAILEMTIIIVILIRKFIIKIDKPIEIAEIGVVLSLSLKPTEPINLKF
ncbi:cytochrome P450 4C1-like isoform X1 [Vespula maculifrons]|uniref:Cytochrome P450 4C1-like isoform X1 n=1 Tax=Vespula maculifrons TaxID=7453 RepID=A0ABD2CVU2_VESMC